MAQKYDIAAKLHADAGSFIAAFAAAERSIDSFNRSVTQMNMASATNNLATFGRENRSSGDAVAKNARQLDRFNRTARGFAMGGIVSAASFGAAMIGSLGAFASYESALAGVKKTVNASSKEYRDLDLQFREMSTTMPTTYQEIAKVAEVAGQLGVKKGSITEFTETMIRLGESTVLSAEDAAMGIQRIMNVMGTASGDVDRFGATLVDLGNNFSTNEDEILEMTQRLSGMANQMGMSEADAMALATAMSSVGIKSEMGGSAMSRTMVKMNKSLQQGGESAKKWADLMGVSVQDAAKLMEEDAYGALIKMLKGMEKAQDGGKNLDTILGELGITELRQVDTLKRLVGATDQVSEAQKVANGAWKDNSALLQESNKRFETFASQVEMAWNRIKNIFANMGAALAGSKSDFVGSLNEMLIKVEEITNKFIGSEGEVTRFGQSFATAAKAITMAAGVVGVAGAAFMAFGPAGAVTVGVAAGLGAIVLAGKKVADYFNAGPLEKGMRKIETVSDETSHKAASNYLGMKDDVLNSLGDMAMGATDKTIEMKNGMIQNLDGLGTMSKKEAQEMKNNILNELDDLTNKAIQQINKSEKRMADLTKNLMKNAGETETAALKQNLQEQKRIFEEKRQIVKDAEGRITDILSSASEDRRALTQTEFAQLGTAFSKIDNQFETSISANVQELGKLQSAFSELDEDASLDKIQKSLTDMSKSTIKAMGQLDKAYEKQSDSIQNTFGDTEQAKQLQSSLTRSYDEQKSALLDNLTANEDRAKSLNENADAMADLTEKERRKLGVVKDNTAEEVAYAQVVGMSAEKNKTLAQATEEASNAQQKSADKARDAAKGYLEAGAAIDTIPEKFEQIKSASDEAATAIGQGFVTKFKDGFEGVDITGVGRMKVDEFVQGVKSGELDVNDVGIAHINQLRSIMGKESLTPEGRKTLESFVAGLREGKASVSQVATQLSVDLKSKTKIDLGSKGMVTTESFVNGLRDGTYGLSEFSQFLNQRLQTMAKKDLTSVGKQDMQTLSAGLNSGLITVDEVGTMLEQSLKQNSKVNLTEEGRQSITTLLQGLKTGEVSVTEFTNRYKKILKQNSKANLTSEGTQTMNSFNTGLNSGAGPVKQTATNTKTGVESVLGSTTDGGGGQSTGLEFMTGLFNTQPGVLNTANIMSNTTETTLGNTSDGGGGSKAGLDFHTGIFQAVPLVDGTANQIKGNTESTLGSTTDGGGGSQAGGDMNSGLAGFSGDISGTASSIKDNTESTLGSTTDGNGGSQSGSLFNGGLAGNIGGINGTSNQIKGNTESTLGSATDGGGGNKSGSMFVNGLGGQSGNANSAGINVANSGKGGLGSVGGSHGLGADFGLGFVNGILSKANAVWNAAKSLAQKAYNAIKNTQRSNSPAKETLKLGNDFGDGYWIGVKERQKEAMKASASLARNSVQSFDKALGKNPFDLGKVVDMRKNLNTLRPKMNSIVKNNLAVDVPRNRISLDVNVHADQEWIRADVNEGNAIDNRLDYMNR